MTISLPAIVLLPALAWVVVTDLLYRRISNRLVIILLAAWGIYAAGVLIQGDTPTRLSLLTGVLAGAGTLLVGYIFFCMRWMGAGDVKLMAVLCLWLGDSTFTFLIVTALAGGVLALGLPMLYSIERAVGTSLLQFGAWLSRLSIPTPHALGVDGPQGIPYGLAIACGAVFVLWSTG